MSYLTQFDTDYCSEDDSDYVPSQADSVESCDISDTSDMSDMSDMSDCESMEEFRIDTIPIQEVSIQRMIPTHIRITKGKSLLLKGVQKGNTIVKTMNTVVESKPQSKRMRIQPTRYQGTM